MAAPSGQFMALQSSINALLISKYQGVTSPSGGSLLKVTFGLYIVCKCAMKQN